MRLTQFSLLFFLTACTSHPLSTTDLQCLTLNIYHEARGEGLIGMLAVGEVTLNRVNDKRWPSSICAVVYQEKQFSWTHDKLPDAMKEPESAYLSHLVAKELLAGTKLNLTKGATHYHANYVRPYWAESLIRTTTINNHIFYK
ncbi:cell wall hydrolase [Spartinivicinus ruber]|uniref:cell wall hydrolase n=1 Tax=Spartinivicinus ruber TaxID=2683272 RepID=UPI0013D07D62|nr:cell wall hydrolase [Spartinivicinus ruber]